MFRVSVVFLAVIASILAKDQGENPEDESLYIDKCCKREFGKPETAILSQECYRNGDKHKTKSDMATCLATKKGINTPDGKLDMAMIIKYIEDEYETDPDLITLIKKACVEGDASKYSEGDDLNEVAMFLSCESYQLVMTCDDDDPCHDGGAFRVKIVAE